MIWGLLPAGVIIRGGQEYENSCTNCPALAIGKRTASRALAAKAVALENLWHLVIAPSGQLVSEAALSSLFGHSHIKKVALGVAGGLKVTEEQSRDAFGLSGDEAVIMFGCQKFTDQRKGMPILSEALVKLVNFSKKYRRRICLLTVGETKSLQPELSKYFRVINLGTVDRKTLDMAYKAASVFVCPSLEDSGLLMVSEALVAGTPIVGFKTGILPDLIVPFETGVLADEKTSQSLFLALRDFLIFSDGNEKEISEKCLLLGRKKCLAENQAEEFLGAIEEFYSSGIR